MNVEEIRRLNLIKLIGGGVIKEFAARADCSANHLSQIMSEHIDAIMGSRLARKIETKLALPEGWLDRLHDDPLADIDEDERDFMETALLLFRASPRAARKAINNMLKEQYAQDDAAS